MNSSSADHTWTAITRVVKEHPLVSQRAIQFKEVSQATGMTPPHDVLGTGMPTRCHSVPDARNRDLGARKCDENKVEEVPAAPELGDPGRETPAGKGRLEREIDLRIRKRLQATEPRKLDLRGSLALVKFAAIHKSEL